MSNETKAINRVKVKINGEDYYIKGTVSEDTSSKWLNM